MKRILTTSLACLFWVLFVTNPNLLAQEIDNTLERKGTFGAQIENMPNGDGIKVVRVIENSTAAQIDLQASDVITTVNGKAYNEVMDLVAAIGTWRQGAPLSVEVERNGSSQTLEGKVQGKPLETSEHGRVLYGSVEYDGGKLRSILEIPNGVKNPPVVFFLPGVGCGTLESIYEPASTVKLLVEDIVASGIAVYRVDKPNMGDGEGTQDCEKMDFDYEVAAFRTALDKLKTLADINTNQIFLYGHSLGVVSAPLVAFQKEVAGIIAWGGISRTWYEYSLKMQRDQKILRGEDYAAIDEEFRKKQPFLHDFYVQKQTPQTLAKNPAYADLMDWYFQNDMVFGLHHYTYFHQLNEIDIPTAYKNADCPVLALAGEFDLHAIDTDWAAEIADVVNHYRPNEGTSLVIPKTTHHYHTVPSMATYLDLRSNRQLNSVYMADHFNKDVPFAVAQWVKSQIEQAPDRSVKK